MTDDAIGVILYLMLAGRLPFEDENTHTLMDKICSKWPSRFLAITINSWVPSREVSYAKQHSSRGGQPHQELHSRESDQATDHA